MRVLNEVLRFVLECVLIGVFAWFGWWLGDSLLTSLLLSVAFVLVFALTWGGFAAPKRRFATPSWVPGVMFVGYGVLAVAALVVMGFGGAGVVLAVLVLVNEIARLAGLEVADR